MTLLDIEEATPDSFAPFGAILGVGETPGRVTPFYGDAVQLWRPKPFVSEGDTCFSIARITPREPSVRFMERHFLHTQAFVPIGGGAFVLVVAPPADQPLPDPAALRAFLFQGCGAQLHIGTWHEFPFTFQDATDVLIVLSNNTYRDVHESNGGEVSGPDIEKRDMVMRLGLQLALRMPVAHGDGHLTGPNIRQCP